MVGPATLLPKVESITQSIPLIQKANLKLLNTPSLSVSPLMTSSSTSSGAAESKPWSDRQGYLNWAVETATSGRSSAAVDEKQAIGTEEDATVRFLFDAL